jgi:hypothetical protein
MEDLDNIHSNIQPTLIHSSGDGHLAAALLVKEKLGMQLT